MSYLLHFCLWNYLQCLYNTHKMVWIFGSINITSYGWLCRYDIKEGTCPRLSERALSIACVHVRGRLQLFTQMTEWGNENLMAINPGIPEIMSAVGHRAHVLYGKATLIIFFWLDSLLVSGFQKCKKMNLNCFGPLNSK